MSESQPDLYDQLSPVGSCIYCGCESASLSDEHIIAFALGGKRVLPQASCPKCAEITSKIEGHCLAGMLKNFRVRIGMPSRHSKPSKLPLHITTEQGGPRTELIPVEEYPIILPLPHYPLPGILVDRLSTRRNEVRGWYTTAERNLDSVYQRYGGKSWTVTRYKPVRFSQMLAKIAHAHAIAVLSKEIFDRFEPLLPDFILGEPDDPCHLVGCDEELEPALHQRAHIIGDLYATTPDKEYLLIRVRLFANLGSPSYLVVAGARSIS